MMAALVAFAVLIACALAALALADMRRDAAERLSAIVFFLFALSLALAALSATARQPSLLDAALMLALIAAPLTIAAAKALDRERGGGA